MRLAGLKELSVEVLQLGEFGKDRESLSGVGTEECSLVRLNRLGESAVWPG